MAFGSAIIQPKSDVVTYFAAVLVLIIAENAYSRCGEVLKICAYISCWKRARAQEVGVWVLDARAGIIKRQASDRRILSWIAIAEKVPKVFPVKCWNESPVAKIVAAIENTEEGRLECVDVCCKYEYEAMAAGPLD